jgi:hypothetical protein
MKLVTRKSECKKDTNVLVTSPKEAIRKTLSNYLIKNGVIVKIYQPSYISKEEIVLNDLTIKLNNNNSRTKIAN